MALSMVPLSSSAATEPRFSADDVLRGVPASREACGEPGRLWVEVDGGGECLRFYAAQAGSPARPPLVYLEGDVVEPVFPMTDPPTWRVADYYLRLSPAMMQLEAEQYAAATARTFVFLARPGTFGSSGRHLERRREREVALVDRGLDLLKERFGWRTIDLTGVSGGGHLVGALLARRDDIGCAVIASGNLAVRQRLREWGLETDVTGYADFVDPLDHVDEVARHPPRRIIVLTDPADRTVSATSQSVYVAALRARGVAVEQRFVPAWDPNHHLLRAPAIIAGLACRPDEIPD